MAESNTKPTQVVRFLSILAGALLLCACDKESKIAGAPVASATVRALAKPAKLGLCAGCHGDTGKAVLPIYPNLAGQNAAYLEKSLHAYRSGERKSNEMRPMVGTLTDAEIVEFARYFAEQKLH
jgi:cytochrome c553